MRWVSGSRVEFQELLLAVVGAQNLLHHGLQEELAARAALEQAQQRGAAAPTAEALAERDQEIRCPGRGGGG